MPPVKLGHVFGSTMEYPMAMFAGDLAAANVWSGDAAVTLQSEYAKAISKLKLASLRACLLDVGGGAHVAFVFRDGDALVVVEDAGDDPDIGSAAVKRAAAVAADPGKLVAAATIDVPSGVLVIGEGWKDFDGDVLGGGKPPAGEKAKSIDDEALVVRVAPGTYAVTRRKIVERTPGVIRIAPA